MRESTSAAVRHVVAGEPDEFAELLREQGRPVRRMVERVSGGIDADDVQQEFLIRAFQHRGRILSLPPDDRCRWSWTVARNIAAKLRRTAWDVDLLAEIPETAAVAPDPLDLHVAREGRQRLAAALDDLHPDDRHLVVARAVHNTPYAVLAEQLDASETTLRRRYGRVCDRLRRNLTGGVLSILPSRWVFRPVRPGDDAVRTAGLPVAVSTVMAGVLAYPFVRPQGAAPRAAPPAAVAAAPGRALDSPRAAPGTAPVARERDVSRTARAAGTGAAAVPAPSDAGPPRRRRPELRLCVHDKKLCVGAPGGNAEAPGDELFVEAPRPVGRVGIRQNSVELCEAVPDLGAAGCQRHD